MTLAYPDCSKEFEIYTNASSKQMGAKITQCIRNSATYQDSMNLGFSNCSEKDVINPLTVKEIVGRGQINLHFTTLLHDDKYKAQHIENTQVQCKSNSIVLLVLSNTEL